MARKKKLESSDIDIESEGENVNNISISDDKGTGVALPDPLQDILNKLDKIEKNHNAFKEKAVEMVNKQTERINDILKEISQANPVVSSNNETIMQQQQQPQSQQQQNYIDKDGINWGNNYKGKDEFSGNNDNKVIKKLNSWGVDPNQIVNILGSIANSYIQKNQQGSIGQVFQEFMVREFFENYQTNKLQQKAQFGMMLKKGWITDEDYTQVTDNAKTLNDPLNKMIEGMRNKK